MFDIVVAADREWGIGKDNALPWPKLKGDLAHFKRITCEAPEGQRNAIVMGRKTWESAEVAGKPLPRRLNIVISRRALAVPEGVLAATSLDGALAKAVGVASTFVVGGAQIFREAFDHPQLRYVYLTRVDGAFGTDAKLPDLDARGFVVDAWEGAYEGEDSGVRYRIERLTRKGVTSP
ncbi:MAG: dihydrofolate reductase [Kofleriaceae bacterium]|nr:dihydrofolate reductase [Kofleriaceae bacterium]